MTCMASFLLILGAAFRIASSIAIVIRSDSDALVAPVCSVHGQSYYDCHPYENMIVLLKW